jgi:LmbE family N-acetylglucosaminyl deacetylase
MAIFPHPDDETLGLGSTIARYASEGIETYLVCATHGERGWFESEGPDPGFEEVARIRTGELQRAADNLGLQEVTFLDYIDGDVDQANPEEIIRKLVMEIRRVRPEVIVTFAPDGGYGHPDHIALSQFTNGAIVCAADASFQDGLSSHRVAKLYYMVDSVEIVRAANESFGGLRMEIDGVIRHHVGWEHWQITTVLNNQKVMDKVQKAIQCHKSQLSGYGPIGEMSVIELAKLFGTGYFYRAFSLVNGGRNVETDLFEGLR